MKELLSLYRIIVILLYRKIDITQEILDKNKCFIGNLTRSEFISHIINLKLNIEHIIEYENLSNNNIRNFTGLRNSLGNILYDIEAHPYRQLYIQDI